MKSHWKSDTLGGPRTLRLLINWATCLKRLRTPGLDFPLTTSLFCPHMRRPLPLLRRCILRSVVQIYQIDPAGRPHCTCWQGRNQLFIWGAIFMKFHSITSSCLFNRGTTLSQTVTYNNNVFLPADTKSVAQIVYTHSAQRWLIKTHKTERFTTALEAESPVGG